MSKKKYTANKFAVLDRDTCLSKWKSIKLKKISIQYIVNEMQDLRNELKVGQAVEQTFETFWVNVIWYPFTLPLNASWERYLVTKSLHSQLYSIVIP